MNEIQDLIEKTINPPGMLKKNRRALFLAIRDIALLVKKDALTAFNAHFPYLADPKKLQEHGNALLIPHLLHDTETEYRERVASASFFLMKAGERQYIMGQLEERFTIRYKIIEEFLNVHLKVTDLADDEREWALELLDGLLNPNIYAELSEWFHYIDNVILSETALYNYERQDIDFFEEKILRDGRILRDGKTIFNKTVKVLRDGSFKRNGRYGRSGSYTFPETNIMRLPLSRQSGYRDVFIFTLNNSPVETQPIFETTPPFDLSNVETETLPSSDLCPVVVKKPMSDMADILDTYVFKYSAASFREEAAIDEEFTVGRRKRRYRDGAYLRDGSTLRDSMVLLPL
jgi:hypothetical protein